MLLRSQGIYLYTKRIKFLINIPDIHINNITRLLTLNNKPDTKSLNKNLILSTTELQSNLSNIILAICLLQIDGN